MGLIDPLYGANTEATVSCNYFQRICPRCGIFNTVEIKPQNPLKMSAPIKIPDPHVVECAKCGLKLAIMRNAEY